MSVVESEMVDPMVEEEEATDKYWNKVREFTVSDLRGDYHVAVRDSHGHYAVKAISEEEGEAECLRHEAMHES